MSFLPHCLLLCVHPSCVYACLGAGSEGRVGGTQAHTYESGGIISVGGRGGPAEEPRLGPRTVTTSTLALGFLTVLSQSHLSPSRGEFPSLWHHQGEMVQFSGLLFRPAFSQSALPPTSAPVSHLALVACTARCTENLLPSAMFGDVYIIWFMLFELEPLKDCWAAGNGTGEVRLKN